MSLCHRQAFSWSSIRVCWHFTLLIPPHFGTSVMPSYPDSSELYSKPQSPSSVNPRNSFTHTFTSTQIIPKSSLSFQTSHPNSSLVFPAMSTQKWLALNSKPKYQSTPWDTGQQFKRQNRIHKWIWEGHQIYHFSIKNEYFNIVYKYPILFCKQKKLSKRYVRPRKWLPLENRAMDGGRMERDSPFTLHHLYF